MDIKIGEVLRLKKPHPCGGNEFEVLSAGAEFKLICGRCGHIVFLPRKKLEKQICRI